MFAGYSRRDGGGGAELPRIVQLRISRYKKAAPRKGEALEFLVAIHEEGTSLTWQQNVRVSPARERELTETVDDLARWSVGLGLTLDQARAAAHELGEVLYELFLGAEGEAHLATLRPTAVLLEVDETILSLPWEMLMLSKRGAGLDAPFGRVVTTRCTTKPTRDPLQEDPTVEVLAIVNPTSDLAASTAELDVLRQLEGTRDGVTMRLTVLDGDRATRRHVEKALTGKAFDMIHFAGHGRFDDRSPGHSALSLSDGRLTANEVLALPWASPPYLVFNSACESGRALAGRRLVSWRGSGNGLAAGFLSAGCEAYLGHFWPVGDGSAAELTGVFYSTLFSSKNVGTAVHTARSQLAGRLHTDGDLTAFGTIFFGDAGSAERRDLGVAMA